MYCESRSTPLSLPAGRLVYWGGGGRLDDTTGRVLVSCLSSGRFLDMFTIPTVGHGHRHVHVDSLLMEDEDEAKIASEEQRYGCMVAIDSTLTSLW